MSLWGKGPGCWFSREYVAVEVALCLPPRDSFCPSGWFGRGKVRPDSKFVKTITNIAIWISVVCPKGMLINPSNFSQHFNYSVFPHSCGIYASLSFLNFFFPL